jgi:NADH:ubiquinone oxidoreductase subunit 5 (subunit L)/multisubunit Na+/H+ antiporter MnhA subunit
LGAVVAGFIGLPQFWRELLGVSAPFYDFLAPLLGHAQPRADVPHSAEWVLMLVAVALALAGITLAWLRYGRGAAVATVEATPAGGVLQRVVGQGYGFDRFYDGVVVGFAGWLSAFVGTRIVEPLLSALSLSAPAALARAVSRGFGQLQTGNLQAYLIYALLGLAAVLGWGVAHV